MKKITDTLSLPLLQEGMSSRRKLQLYAQHVDTFIQHIADAHGLSNVNIVATGGYGRRDLYLHSDLDVLILQQDDQYSDQISAFVQALWDAGIHISHRVQTPSECYQTAKLDQVFLTALVDARSITGSPRVFNELWQTIIDEVWSFERFLDAKIQEQQLRHQKYTDNLEPDIKNSPGALRDIHMIQWLIKYRHPMATYTSIIAEQILSADELRCLLESHEFLSQVRWALQQRHKKNITKLRFDDQIELASTLAYIPTGQKKAVEQFMQTFYLASHNVRIINRLIRYQCEGNFDTHVALHFEQHPEKMLEAVDERNPHILRAIQAHAHRMTPEQLRTGGLFERFLSLLDDHEHLYMRLNRLHDYGLLSHMIPALAEVKGQMQFDLFHVHTVDRHTLEVMRELSEYFYGKYEEKHPLGHHVAQSFKAHRVVYLAALFHDLGKGKGCDHSEWGAHVSQEYFEQFVMPNSDISLISWLVKEHLLMSMTSQKKDTTDQLVIEAFAKRVGSVERLNALFILTISDIRGTNPKLMNSWRMTLLDNLYKATLNTLDTATHDVPKPHSLEALINSMDNASIVARPHPNKHEIELLLHVDLQRHLSVKVATVISSLKLNIVEARYHALAGEKRFHHYVLSQEKPRKPPFWLLQEIQKSIGTQLSTEKSKPPKRLKFSQTKARHFPTSDNIVFSQHPDGLTLLEIETKDRPGLIADITRVFAFLDIRTHHAKIMTLGERAEDIFTLSDQHNAPLSEDIQSVLKVALDEIF